METGIHSLISKLADLKISKLTIQPFSNLSETGDWRQETGDWRPETEDRRPETGNWKLETGDWRLESKRL